MPQPNFLTLIAQNNDSPRTLQARRAGIYSGTLIAAAAYTSTQTGLTFQVPAGGNVMVFLVITAASGTGGLTLKIEQQDPTSLSWINIGNDTGPRIAVSVIGFVAGPGSGGAGTMSNSSYVTKQIPLCGTCRVTVTHGDASSYTYSANVMVMGPG